MSTSELNLMTKTDTQIPRKLWHTLAGLIAIFAYHWGIPRGISHSEFAFAALLIGVFSLSFDMARLRLKGLNALFFKYFSAITRESEKKSLSGMPYYAFGCAVALYLFEPAIGVLAIYFLVFADPIASYIGIKFGRDKIMPGKSLQGSLAAFMVCYFITFFYLEPYLAGFQFWGSLLFSLLAGIVGSVSELFSKYIDDNFSIPVVSGIGLTFINLFFGYL